MAYYNPYITGSDFIPYTTQPTRVWSLLNQTNKGCVHPGVGFLMEMLQNIFFFQPIWNERIIPPQTAPWDGLPQKRLNMSFCQEKVCERLEAGKHIYTP